MDAVSALPLIAEMRPRDMAKLWSAGRDIGGDELRNGLWVGRNGRVPAPMRWLLKSVMKRDSFAKLVFDDFGVNVRVTQDGRHSPLPSTEIVDGVKVDLPFAPTSAGLDYGVHVLGIESDAVLPMRDILRAVDLETFASVAPTEIVAEVDIDADDRANGELIVGYFVPLAVEVLKGAPFGMAWKRDATDQERACAEAWIAKRRTLDSSVPSTSAGS